MKNTRWFLFAAVAVPAFAACGGDDSSDGMVDAGGAGGSGGISTDSGSGATGGKAGAGGSAGSAGSGGSAGAPKDAANGSDSGAARDGGAGGSSGSGGMAGASGAAGTNIDAASDTTTLRDATFDGTGGGRPDSGSVTDAPSPDGGGACSSGPAMGMTCTHYCSGWFATCQPIAMWSATYASQAACMSACGQWNDAKLCCRAEHVHNATVAPNANQAEKHCGHAVGVDAPDACL